MERERGGRRGGWLELRHCCDGLGVGLRHRGPVVGERRNGRAGTHQTRVRGTVIQCVRDESGIRWAMGIKLTSCGVRKGSEGAGVPAL